VGVWEAGNAWNLLLLLEMWGYDNQRCEEDYETENDHEEDRDFRWQWREPLSSQEERCKRLSRGRLVEPLVRCTVD